MDTVIPRTLLYRRLSSEFGVGNFTDDKRREIYLSDWLGTHAFFNASNQ